MPCITGDGGTGDIHPSGACTFTLREMALLNGLSPYHQFSDTYIKKQIGNVVPSSVFRKFMAPIRDSLLQFSAGEIDCDGKATIIDLTTSATLPERSRPRPQ